MGDLVRLSTGKVITPAENMALFACVSPLHSHVLLGSFRGGKAMPAKAEAPRGQLGWSWF
jgi:hypothetical protein